MAQFDKASWHIAESNRERIIANQTAMIDDQRREIFALRERVVQLQRVLGAASTYAIPRRIRPETLEMPLLYEGDQA